MSSGRGYPSNVQQRSTRRKGGATRAGRDEGVAFAARWAVEACDRCGRTIVMGEPVAHVRRFERDIALCATCLARVPDKPTWVAAPSRHGRPAVPLVTRERELRRVA